MKKARVDGCSVTACTSGVSENFAALQKIAYVLVLSQATGGTPTGRGLGWKRKGASLGKPAQGCVNSGWPVLLRKTLRGSVSRACAHFGKRNNNSTLTPSNLGDRQCTECWSSFGGQVLMFSSCGSVGEISGGTEVRQPFKWGSTAFLAACTLINWT